jgi:hypothetical protein
MLDCLHLLDRRHQLGLFGAPDLGLCVPFDLLTLRVAIARNGTDEPSAERSGPAFARLSMSFVAFSRSFVMSRLAKGSDGILATAPSTDALALFAVLSYDTVKYKNKPKERHARMSAAIVTAESTPMKSPNKKWPPNFSLKLSTTRGIRRQYSLKCNPRERLTERQRAETLSPVVFNGPRLAVWR